MTDDNLAEVLDRLSPDDELVLQCIDQGLEDLNLVTQATVLNRNQVHHRFRKLSGRLDYFEPELIDLEREKGTVEREVNGVKQVFESPKKAGLTDLGSRVVKELEENRLERYRRMSRDELAEELLELEQELEDLKQSFEIFRSQVQDHIYSE